MAAAVCVRVSVCVRIRGCQKKNENELRRIIKATAAPIPVSRTKNTGAGRTTHTHIDLKITQKFTYKTPKEEKILVKGTHNKRSCQKKIKDGKNGGSPKKNTRTHMSI